MGNRIRILLARLLITAIHYPWRAAEKTLRTRFPLKDHYLITRAFRLLSREFPVTITYANPVSDRKLDITLNLDLCQNSQDWYFRQTNTYERDWIRVIAQAMESAQEFIDVGAHIGVYSLAVAQAFPDKKVVAVEPWRKNHTRLKENILANGLGNIETHLAAVTDAEGPVSFYVNPLNDGGGSIVQSADYRTGDVRITATRYQRQNPGFTPLVTVDTLRLDQLISSSCVLKIDVEGAELSVLRSAENSLNDGKIDLIVVEVTSESIREVVELLTGTGFDCFFESEGSPISDVSLLPRGLGNILCLKRQSNAHDSKLSDATSAVS